MDRVEVIGDGYCAICGVVFCVCLWGIFMICGSVKLCAVLNGSLEDSCYISWAIACCNRMVLLGNMRFCVQFCIICGHCSEMLALPMKDSISPGVKCYINGSDEAFTLVKCFYFCTVLLAAQSEHPSRYI